MIFCSGEAVRHPGHQPRRQLRRLLPHRRHHGGGRRTQGLPQRPVALLRRARQHAGPQSLEGVRHRYEPPIQFSAEEFFENFCVSKFF